MIRSLPVLASLLMLGIAGPAFAVETVTTLDGKEVRGNFQSMDKNSLTLKPTVGDAVTIQANEIVSVEWTDDPPGMNLARINERNNLPDKALELYLKAEIPPNANNLKADMAFLIARASAGIARKDPAKLDDAIAKLEAFRTGNGSNFRYYQAVSLLGELYTQKQDVQNAEAMFAELEKAPWPDYKMAAQVQQGHLKLSQNQVDEALQIFDKVAAMPTENAAQQNRKLEAMLGKATCEVRKQNFDPALAVLDEVAKLADAKDATLQAVVYLRRGDALQAQKKVKPALFAYLHVDTLFFQNPEQHAEALYHLSKLWTEAGKPERGNEARARLRQTYSESEWAKKP